MRRASSLLVALTAAVAELVILAAAGNQWIVDHLTRHPAADELPRDRLLKQTLTAFPWRFTPPNDLRMTWIGWIVADAGLVLVVFLVVLAFTAAIRPPRRFLAVFLGVWGLVLGLTQIAAIGRVLLAHGDLFSTKDPDGLGRYWYSAFNGLSAPTVLFGAVSGLLVGIVAGIFARVANAAATEPEDEFAPPPAPMRDEGAPWQPGELGSGVREPMAQQPPSSWPPVPEDDSTRSWSSPATTRTAVGSPGSGGRSGGSSGSTAERNGGDDAPTSVSEAPPQTMPFPYPGRGPTYPPPEEPPTYP